MSNEQENQQDIRPTIEITEDNLNTQAKFTSAPNLDYPPIAEKEYHIATHLYDSIYEFKKTSPLNLAQHLNLNDLKFKITKIFSTKIKSHSKKDIAIAMHQKNAPSSKFALVLPVYFAKALSKSLLGSRASAQKSLISKGDLGIILYLLDQTIGDWRKLSTSPVTIAGLLSGPHQLIDWLGDKYWSIQMQACSKNIKGDFFIHGTALENHTKHQSKGYSLENKKEPASFNNWPCCFSLEIGSSCLSKKQLNEVEKGDLLIPDYLAYPLNSVTVSQKALLKSGTLKIPIDFIDKTKITIWNQDKGLNMDNEKTIFHQPQDSNIKSSPDILLTIEAGQIVMPFKKATSLIAGQILNLSKPVGSMVNIKAGDQLIAKGRLVKVKDQIAVEIEEVL